MTWRLTHHGRLVARGSWRDVVEAGEECGLIIVETLGRETAQPVALPRIAVAGVLVAPVPHASLYGREDK